MVGNGVQGTLIGVRASIEGFSTFQLSAVTSAYFLGFLGGSMTAPGIIKRVGHVRVFASLASIASISILLHSLHFSVITWFLMRYTTGFCFVGMYCVAESWINHYTSIVKHIWRVWAKALGDKSGKSDKEADTVAIIRTIIFLQLVITNCFIIAGNIRHWNDHYTPPKYERNASPNL